MPQDSLEEADVTMADGTEPGAEPHFFARVAELRTWLERHHGLRSDLWVKVAKKSTGIESVTAPEIIDAVLCYGWIDGQRKSLDEEYYLQRISRRRKGGHWSQVNVRKVEALTAVGLMREPGLAEVRAAQEDGRWAAAYPSQKEATVPEDLAAALTMRLPGGAAVRGARQDGQVPGDSRAPQGENARAEGRPARTGDHEAGVGRHAGLSRPARSGRCCRPVLPGPVRPVSPDPVRRNCRGAPACRPARRDARPGPRPADGPPDRGCRRRP